MKNYEIIFADLGGALINTISGEIFPKGIWDMKINFEVLDKIKEIKPKCLLIVTNQGGIEKGFVNERNFQFKMEYICRSIKEYTGVEVEYSYCTSNDKILMIGDASGKERQFSDSDKKCAENAGFDYLDVNDFIKKL